MQPKKDLLAVAPSKNAGSLPTSLAHGRNGSVVSKSTNDLRKMSPTSVGGTGRPGSSNASHAMIKFQRVNSSAVELKKDGHESVMDELGQDLRKGLQFGIAKLRRALMASKVSVTSRDDYGCSLLMSAAQGGLLQSVRDLIKRDAPLEDKDPEGNTAMHYAVLYERAKVEEALIEAGAERYPANNIGETPDDTNLERLRQHAFRELRQGQSGFVLRVIGKQWIPADLREGEEGRLLTHGRRMSLTVIRPRTPSRSLGSRPSSGAGVTRLRSTSSGRRSRSPRSRQGSPAPPGERLPPISPSKSAERSTDKAADKAVVDKFSSPGKAGVLTISDLDGGTTQQRGRVGPSEVPLDESRGRTLLMYACELGLSKVVKMLVRMRADVSARSKDGVSAVELCATAGNVEHVRYLNSKLAPEDQVDEVVEATTELGSLRKSFLVFCAQGSAGMGTDNALRGGQSRDVTMDFKEFVSFLGEVGLIGTDGPVSKKLANEVFQKVLHNRGIASGEMHWPHFKECLYKVCAILKKDEICGVPLGDLRHDVEEQGENKIRTMTRPLKLVAVSKKCMERDLVWMQNQLNKIGERARETTSCDYAAYGHGVTTGKHSIRRETFNVYRQLLRVPQYQMDVPKFLKPKEQRKKEASAKFFFNTIDTDHSGELTRYELKSALDDYAFRKEEQEEVFRLLEGSSAVRLSDFIKGMMEGDVSFAGRESKSKKSDSFLQIGLSLAKRVTKKEQPDKILSISPGLFGMMHKMFCDFALSERLASFDKSSCVYAPPQLSALAVPDPSVRKSSMGINTRFAVVNPFDPRVLAATAPNGSTTRVSDSPHPGSAHTTHSTGRGKSPSKSPPAKSPPGSPHSRRNSNSPEPGSKRGDSPERQSKRGVSPEPRRGKSPEEKPSSKMRSSRDGCIDESSGASPRRASRSPERVLSRHGRNGSVKSPEGSPKGGKSPSGESRYSSTEYAESQFVEPVPDDTLPSSFAHSSMMASLAQAGGRGYKSQSKTMNPGLLQGLSPAIRKKKFHEPEITISPDGNLLSEHTRITLLPARLTITESGQVLVGAVETDESIRNPGTIAQQKVKSHRITRASMDILSRVVFRSLSTGAGHCAAVTDTGLVYTWGQGRYGQLGHGDDADKIVPQPVNGIKGEVLTVSCGFKHTAAVTRAGALFTWGDGKEGKLGHNDDAQRLNPTQVTIFVEQGLPLLTAQAGGSHTVVLTNSNTVFTFGAGASGRLGHGNDQNQWLPTPVQALEFVTVVSLAAGFAHTAALTDTGEIFTWGSGKLGRLGHGSDSDEVLPRQITLFSHSTVRPIAVAAGEAHTCIFRSDGSMVTIGRLTHGRIAEGTCVKDLIGDLQTAMAMQEGNDWHHFPT